MIIEFTVALHEAAHAVIAMHHKLPVRLARVHHDADANRGGYVHTYAHRKGWHKDFNADLAGMLAVRKYEPWSLEWLRGTNGDFKSAAETYEFVWRDHLDANSARWYGDTWRIHLRMAIDEAKQTVDEHYTDILKVAEVLHVKKVLTGREIKTILAKPRRRKPILLRASSLGVAA
jgi:hypothetical protein